WGRGRGPLHAPPLPGPHAVVRLRRHVLYAQDLEPGRLERADRRLPAGARALDEDLDLLEAVLHALAGAGVGGHLGGERRRLARAGVRLRALAVHGQAAAVADAAVGADLAQALDRLRALAAQVALDLEVLVDVLAELRDLVVGEVTDLRVRREPEGGGDLPRR